MGTEARARPEGINWEHLQGRELTTEEIRIAIKGMGRNSHEAIIKRIIQEIPYDAEHPKGKAIGPFASKEQAKNVASYLNKITKELGWGMKQLTPNGHRQASTRSTPVKDVKDGYWYLYVTRIAE